MQIVFTISEEKAMSVPAVNSALDVANWFFKQAEREEIYLENEKVQHLLFLAQVHYALLNNKDYLSPACSSATTTVLPSPTWPKPSPSDGVETVLFSRPS